MNPSLTSEWRTGENCDSVYYSDDLKSTTRDAADQWIRWRLISSRNWPSNHAWDCSRPSTINCAAKMVRRGARRWLPGRGLLRFDRWPGMGRAPKVRPGEIGREKVSGIGW